MISSSITVSPAQPNDIYGITDVQKTTWLATYPNADHKISVDDIDQFLNTWLTTERIEKYRARLTEDPLQDIRFVAKNSEQRIVGFAVGRKEHDANVLQAIYVLPEYQHQGIGKMLWENIYAQYNHTKPTIVHVVVYNKQAISFYKKLGFEETGKTFHEEKFRMQSGAYLTETELVLSGASLI